MADSDSNQCGTAVAGLEGMGLADASFARKVHAGIEHTLMQLVSEAFDLMQRTLALSHQPLHGLHGTLRGGALTGYLSETSGHLFDFADEDIARRQVKEKLDAFKSDPAARWILQSARELDVPIPTIEAALGALEFSARERQRLLMFTPFRHPIGGFGYDAESVLEELIESIYAAMIITFAEGFALLAAARARNTIRLDIIGVARDWKGSCDARSAILDDIAAALRATPTLGNLLCDEDIAEKVMAHQESLRRAVWRATELDTVVPAMLASLDFLDSFRDAWLPVNLVQVHRNPRVAACLQ
jgi:6-phosphogluconate dehydrogenase